jgi:23S rRNA G2445 N2-methylase RlmL
MIITRSVLRSSLPPHLPFPRMPMYGIIGIGARMLTGIEAIMQVGNDTHRGALALVHKDAHSAGVLELIDLYNTDVGAFVPPAAPAMVVTNPPWGLRIGGGGRERHEEVEWTERDWAERGESAATTGDVGGGWGQETFGDDMGSSRGDPSADDLEQTWKALGSFLRRECEETPVAILRCVHDTPGHICWLMMMAERKQMS